MQRVCMAVLPEVTRLTGRSNPFTGKPCLGVLCRGCVQLGERSHGRGGEGSEIECLMVFYLLPCFLHLFWKLVYRVSTLHS